MCSHGHHGFDTSSVTLPVKQEPPSTLSPGPSAPTEAPVVDHALGKFLHHPSQ